MTPQELGWRPIVQSFLPKELPTAMPEPLREHIMVSAERACLPARLSREEHPPLQRHRRTSL